MRGVDDLGRWSKKSANGSKRSRRTQKGGAMLLALVLSWLHHLGHVRQDACVDFKDKCFLFFVSKF